MRQNKRPRMRITLQMYMMRKLGIVAWDNPKIQVINITQDFYTMDHINSGAVTFKNYYNQVNRELTIKGMDIQLMLVVNLSHCMV
ncbi:hypothetical protein ACUC2M_21345 [Bacillus cytotoxicus]